MSQATAIDLRTCKALSLRSKRVKLAYTTPTRYLSPLVRTKFGLGHELAEITGAGTCLRQERGSLGLVALTQ